MLHDKQNKLDQSERQDERHSKQQSDRLQKQLQIELEAEASAACLGVPSRRSELPAGAENGLTRGPLSLVHRDTLSVATKLCSTKLTQRGNPHSRTVLQSYNTILCFFLAIPSRLFFH